MFEELHPGCVGVFVFDNSTKHGAFASDALNVGHMNLGAGGAVDDAQWLVCQARCTH